MKRCIAFLLSLVLICNTIPTVSAYSDQAAHAAQELYSLGLFQGGGTNNYGEPDFALDRAPNREEAIAMLVRLLGKEAEALAGTWRTPFTDISTWAKPYVGYAYTHGLTSGISTTLFGSKDTVTAAQYITLVLRALGYSDTDGDFLWSTPWTLSDQINLTHKNYTSANNSSFTRGDIAIISYNALDCNMAGTSFKLRENMPSHEENLLVNNAWFTISLESLEINDSYTEIKFKIASKPNAPDQHFYEFSKPLIQALSINGITYNSSYGFVSVDSPLIANGKSDTATVILSVGKNNGLTQVFNMSADIYVSHLVLDEGEYWGVALEPEYGDGRFSCTFTPNGNVATSPLTSASQLIYSNNDLDLYYCGYISNLGAKYIIKNKTKQNIYIGCSLWKVGNLFVSNLNVYENYEFRGTGTRMVKAQILPNTWSVFYVETIPEIELNYELASSTDVFHGVFPVEREDHYFTANGITSYDVNTVLASQNNTSSPSGSSQSVSQSSPTEPNRVYITATGARYHYDSTCNGGTYYSSSLEDALRKGLTPCKKCVE